MKRRIPVQVIFREYLEGILAAIFLALFLRFFVFSVLYIPSSNMEVGLRHGDFVIGWKLVYGFPIPLQGGERLNAKSPKRGDVVALRFPGDEEQILIRRVIGLPGDKIKIVKGHVEVNSEKATYHDEYDIVFEEWALEKRRYPLKKPLNGEMDELQVPPENVFVLTDNRTRSDDSRNWGVVPIKNIESRIALIWLSVNHDEGSLKVRWNRLLKSVE